jgi:SpoVK/Ycf46/Vps4 family AAA+-type ATPase
MTAMTPITDLFERRSVFPDVGPQERYARLVGLDDHKARLTKILGLLVNPAGLERWHATHHAKSGNLLSAVLRRPPLVVLAGDVGSGKTELAETVGDAVARAEKIDVTLLPLSLSSRGQGRVGEMTQLLSAAFDHAVSEGTKLKAASGKARGGIIMLIDEADALAQSREAAQMHHEDRAGVNALIRGVDRIASNRLPVAVIMCTNRLASLDPAVKRRAADILVFERPADEQRRSVLQDTFGPLGFTAREIDQLVKITGAHNGRDYGFTFSDLMQRLLPSIVLDAYPSRPVTAARAIEVAARIMPTPPFKEQTQ